MKRGSTYYIPPNRAKSQDLSDPNHQSPKKKKEWSYHYINALREYSFTLHSGHVENVSCARYIVRHQSHIFYRTHNRAQEMYVLPL